MSIETSLGNFFKSETKSSGRKLYAEEKVSVSGGSDTSIQAYVRISPPVRVSFIAEDIGSPSFTASCSCPSAKKAQFCKHIWAVLIAVEEKYPDFLAAKRNIDKAEVSYDPEKTSYAETAKARASEYRKDQYQKVKSRAKEKKQVAASKVPSAHARSFPADVEGAIAYFTVNGFPMPVGPDADVIAEAKRKLSRVFHPDRGGTHAEIVELNENYEILARFLG